MSTSSSYVVKFTQPRVTCESEAWWPEGEEETCSEIDAWTRSAHLLALGIAGAPIEGAHISIVRIFDAESGDVMLSIDVWELIFEGPWSERSSPIEEKPMMVMVGWEMVPLGKAIANVGLN